MCKVELSYHQLKARYNHGPMAEDQHRDPVL